MAWAQRASPRRPADCAARAEALDHYAGALLLEHFPVDAFGVLDGPVAALRSVPEEVSLRALALMLQGIGGAGYTPRFDRVEALRKAVLGAEAAGRLKRTLHGAVVGVEQGRLSLRREWGRDGIASIPAAGGADVLWDRRFRVSVPGVGGRFVRRAARTRREAASVQRGRP
jgi:tRNA(Ile)-lysidine synthase